MGCLFFKNSKTRQFFTAVSGGLGLLAVGNWVGWTSPFLAQLKNEKLPYNLTISEQSWVVSLIDFGTIISPLPSGYLMDAYGRKTTLFINAIIFQVSWILAVAANGATMLYTARLLGGMAKGMSFTICAMYLAEIAGPDIRGTVSGIFTVLIFAGTLFEFVAGLFVPITTLNIVSAIVPVVFFISVIFIPESPYYFLMKDDRVRAYKSYCWLHHPNIEPTVVDQRIQKDLDEMDAHVKKEIRSQGRWVHLVTKKGTRHATLVVMTLHAMQRLGGINTMVSYMSTALPNNKGIFRPQQCMVLFAGLLLLTSIVCMPLADMIGRRPTLLLSGVTCAILQAVISVYFYLDGLPNYDASHLLWLPYTSMLAFAVFYQLGLGIMPHTLLGEMFPTNLKSKAAASATICAASSTFLVNKAFPIISETYGKQFMFIFFSLAHSIVAIFTYFCVVETKGKTFGEIQAMLNRRSDPEEAPLIMKNGRKNICSYTKSSRAQ